MEMRTPDGGMLQMIGNRWVEMIPTADGRFQMIERPDLGSPTPEMPYPNPAMEPNRSYLPEYPQPARKGLREVLGRNPEVFGNLTNEEGGKPIEPIKPYRSEMADIGNQMLFGGGSKSHPTNGFDATDYMSLLKDKGKTTKQKPEYHDPFGGDAPAWQDPDAFSVMDHTAGGDAFEYPIMDHSAAGGGFESSTPFINDFSAGGGAFEYPIMDSTAGGGAFEAPMAGGGAGGAGGGVGMSNWAGAATPLAYAYLIGQGKMIENKNPNTALGKTLLGGLGPSYAQIKEDPKGMGLPTALGAAFLTPFTGSKKARSTKPEWAGLWSKAGLPS